MENNVLKGKGQDRSRNNGTRSKILKDPSTLTEIFPGAREALTQFMKSGPLLIDRAEIWDQKLKSFIEFATKMKPKTMDNTPPATPVHVPTKSQNPGKNQRSSQYRHPHPRHLNCNAEGYPHLTITVRWLQANRKQSEPTANRPYHGKRPMGQQRQISKSSTNGSEPPLTQGPHVIKT